MQLLSSYYQLWLTTCRQNSCHRHHLAEPSPDPALQRLQDNREGGRGE